VISVILFHSGFEIFSGGFVGVDVFFVISGYLIATMIESERANRGFSVTDFYKRRARRILPALIVLLLICIPISFVNLLPYHLKDLSQSLVAIGLLSSNFLYWWKSGYFEPAAELKPFLHTWSLAIEQQFYIIFPIILILAGRIRTNRVFIISLISFASLIVCILSTYNHPNAAFYLMPSRFWELSLGALIALHAPRKEKTFLASTLVQEVSAIFGFTLVIFAIFQFDKSMQFPGFYSIVPTLGTCLIIANTNSHGMNRILSNKLLVGVGLISYSLYLWHYPLLSFQRHSGVSDPTNYSKVVTGVVVLIVSYCSWKYIELPFRKMQVSTNLTRIFYSSGIAIIIMFGIIGHYTDGYIFRFNVSDQKLIQQVIAGDSYVRSGNRHDFFEKSSGGKKKILIMGDSFGHDLLNAVTESQLRFKADFVFQPIPCGQLFVEFEEFMSMTRDGKKSRCNPSEWSGNFYSEEMKALMAEADQVWLSSWWQYWQLAAISKSLSNLETEFGQKFIIFGSKNFGRMDISNLLSIKQADRIEQRNKFSTEHIETNDQMIKILSTDIFIDVSFMLCGSKVDCQLFDENLNLLSHDGGHLTVDGARYLGQRLMKNAKINSMFSGH
jgi:peptidoglycan/LPS O-acetylase OafA/YrhL